MYSNIKQQISTVQKLQLLLHLMNVFEVILFATECHMTSGISSMKLCLVRIPHCPRACFLALLTSTNDSSGQGFSLIRSLPWNMHSRVTSVYSGSVLCGRCRVGGWMLNPRPLVWMTVLLKVQVFLFGNFQGQGGPALKGPNKLMNPAFTAKLCQLVTKRTRSLLLSS